MKGLLDHGTFSKRNSVQARNLATEKLLFRLIERLILLGILLVKYENLEASHAGIPWNAH